MAADFHSSFPFMHSNLILEMGKLIKIAAPLLMTCPMKTDIFEKILCSGKKSLD